jgi:hypothetical protein
MKAVVKKLGKIDRDIRYIQEFLVHSEMKNDQCGYGLGFRDFTFASLGAIAGLVALAWM